MFVNLHLIYYFCRPKIHNYSFYMRKNLFLLFLFMAVSLHAGLLQKTQTHPAISVNKGWHSVKNQSSRSSAPSATGQVTFYGNGGTGTMEALSGLSKGQELQLPRNTFTREGYRFVGWSNTPGSNDPVYQDEFARFTYYQDNSALYAVWEPENSALRISFNANGGQGGMEPIYVRASQTIIVPPHRFTPADDGYECKGYGLSADDYNRYRIGGTATFTRSCTLYAFWSPLDGSVGGACEEFKGQSVFVEGVNIAPEDWVQISEKPVKIFAEWKEDCGWYDTDQTWMNFCWAGTSSNAIHWWLDRNRKYIEEYRNTHDIDDFKYYGKGVSDVFRFFTKHWTQNVGGFPNVGFNWFINGMDNKVQESAKGKGGLFKDVFGENTLVTSLGEMSRRTFNKFIVNALKNGCMLSIDESNFSGGHAITCWGAEFDGEGYINALYYTDSATPWNNSLTGRDLSLTKIDIKYHEDQNWRPYMATTVIINGEIQHGEIPITRIYSYSQGTEYWEDYFSSQNQQRYMLICKDAAGKAFDTLTVKAGPDADITLPEYQFRTIAKASADGSELSISSNGTINTSGIEKGEIELQYADSLPFETTTLTGDGFADARWYLLSSNGTGSLRMMRYDAQDNSNIKTTTLTGGDITADAAMWCISGNVTDGFRLYNKEAGTTLAVTYTDENGKAAMSDAESTAAVWHIAAKAEDDGHPGFCFKSCYAGNDNAYLCMTDSYMTFGPAASNTAIMEATDQTRCLTLAATALEDKLHDIPDGAVGEPADRNATAEAIETLKTSPTETNYQAVLETFGNKTELNTDKNYCLISADRHSRAAAHEDGFLRAGETGSGDAGGIFMLEPARDGSYGIKVQGEYVGAAMSNSTNNEIGLEGRSLDGAKIKKGEFALVAATDARFYLQNTNTEADGTTYLHMNGEIVAACGDKVRGTLWYIVEVTTVDVTIGEGGYTTAHYPFGLQLPADGSLKAYTGTVSTEEENRMVLNKLDTEVLPAYTPVILAGDTGTYTLHISAGKTDKAHDADNDLTGTLLPAAVTAEDYILDYRGNTSAFYKADAADMYPGANKAYLPSDNIPASAAGADKFVLSTDGGTTEITNGTADNNYKEVYYDLHGRQIANPSNGIYVTRNGKKVLITR